MREKEQRETPLYVVMQNTWVGFGTLRRNMQQESTLEGFYRIVLGNVFWWIVTLETSILSNAIATT